MTSGRKREEYIRAAVEHHAATLFAAQQRATDAAGGLAHFTVELYLKACLHPYSTDGERRELGHQLPDIWARLQQVTTVATDDLGKEIEELDRFWVLRYPDEIVEKGMDLQVAPKREHLVDPHQGVGAENLPKYALVLEDIGKVAELSFRVCHLNPRAFVMHLRSEARQLLREHSPPSFWD